MSTQFQKLEEYWMDDWTEDCKYFYPLSWNQKLIDFSYFIEPLTLYLCACQLNLTLKCWQCHFIGLIFLFSNLIKRYLLHQSSSLNSVHIKDFIYLHLERTLLEGILGKYQTVDWLVLLMVQLFQIFLIYLGRIYFTHEILLPQIVFFFSQFSF